MMNEKNYKNWHVNRDNDNIFWLTLDKHSANVNTIDAEILDELADFINYLSQNNTAKGLVIGSAKTSGFIAGADVSQFVELHDAAEAKAFIQHGQMVFNRLSALSIPTVAMIDGFCLGGGLELSLACRYRVATDSPATRFGLPEVLLGIHPGWGGCVRLPRLIGAIAAMDLILTGRTVSSKAAAKLGIVDAVVPKRQLMNAARYYVLQHPKPHSPGLLKALSNTGLVRPLLAKQFTKKLREKIQREHYPAPYAAVDIWRQYGVDLNQVLFAEAESLSNLVTNDTAKNLVRIFFLQDRLKNDAKDTSFKVKHVHVIGAGLMGGDIAAWCASHGLLVTLQDREPKFIAPAIKRAQKYFKEKLKDPRLIQAAMDRLIPDDAGIGIAKADLIIEAIFENLAAKQALFKDIEKRAKPDAILATNTSSIPLDEINSVLEHPERLVGIHFFNPVAKMRLVEVVHGKITSDKIQKQASAFVRSIDKLPLPVMSSPGFLVNRVLTPYLMEAMALYQEGVPQAAIDHAAEAFGMPMGPVELADTVGLDVCLSVANNLAQHFGGNVPEHLKQLVADGKLGRKTGQGFYSYKNGKAQKPPVKDYQNNSEITDRLILRLVNEAMACLREHVVNDADSIDAGMVFGTGFAPFRGGPMQYVHQTGVAALKEKLLALEQKYGNRFKPDPLWDEKVIL